MRRTSFAMRTMSRSIRSPASGSVGPGTPGQSSTTIGGVPPAANVLVKGSEDQWVATPVGTLLRVIGTGDVYTALFTVVYPGDARPWHMMGIFELRDGKVARETIVFGAPFDAPAWRAQWVERM